MYPQIFGKYVLERELASGGMAIVYLATLRGAGGFEKRLVVKQIRAELASDSAFVERFVAEAKTTVGLSHPNIVPVYELGVEQGVYFIAMELAQGVTLSELLKTGGRLSPEEGAYLGVEISRALDYAHRKAGIVHRDVTPRNVLVDEEGAVRLIDFGIAAPVTGEDTARERVYGSPGHMPLEQLRGGRLTPATDVFAVGALLLEAWTNEAPFRRATRAESDQALSVSPPPLSRVDPALSALDGLLARAVASDPALRPQTPEDLARPLREFLRTADLGDIARRLGERVRRARRASKSSVRPPPPGGSPSTAPLQSLPATPVTRPLTAGGPSTPTTRPLTQPVTETFAAREEVSEWTRPRSEPPAGADVEPVPPAAFGGTPSPAPRRAPRVTFLFAVAVAVAVASAVAAAIGAQFALRPGPLDDTPVTARSALPAPAPLSPTLPAPALVGSGAPVAPERGESPSPPSLSVVPAASADEAKLDVAVFTFTSDLPARVSLDGASLGSTPLRGLRKPPGRHVVTFVSAELDEKLTATVRPTPGQAVAIHAEFTRAVPALRIH